MTITKRLSIVIIAIAVTMAFMPMMSQNQIYAASKKPATVKITKVSVKGTTVTVKWKKAKRAKKYQVKAGTKIVKTTSKTSAVFKVKKSCTVKVRGVNGKKKGSYSKSKKVTIKTPSKPKNPQSKEGKVHSETITIDKDFDYGSLVVGDTYMLKIKDVPEPYKVKVTSIEDRGGVCGVGVEGTTEHGGFFNYSYCAKSAHGYSGEGYEFSDSVSLNDMWSEKDVPYSCVHIDAVNGDQWELKSKAGSGVTFYWTLDGTEPRIGQKDRYGATEYFHNDNKPVENAKLAGTVTEGNTGIMREELHDMDGKQFCWVKGYKDGKVVYENMIHNE
ncbi:hypothetical protein [Hornefia butyriciproducens]|uniref:hypothetical protein n=1 Tax=Hornefia butyriciproducens TaxID=2652293 RepID=UPI003F88D07D